jgi:PAS domain S-box-containing protein
MDKPKVERRPALAADLIVANAPDPVFVSDLKGKILKVNKAVSELLGLRRDEVLEQSLSRFLSAEETREFVAAVREVVEHGVTRNVRLAPRSTSGEVILTTLNASALRDPRGKVIGVIGILRDMRELDKARQYAESLIKDAPDPVFVSDLEGKILQANAAVSELLGFHEDEVVEHSLSRFISPEETREFVAALREVVERGITRNVRLNPRSASGEVIPTTLNASARRDADGRVTGAIGILRDMRAYDQVVRALEDSRARLQAADQAKDRFLATVSHELRTPLTAMLGWTRMLQAGMLDSATTARALKAIERNSELQAKLIEDLLDLSRIVTGKLRLELQPVDPVGVIEESIDAVQALAEAKTIALRVALDALTGSVLADPRRLQQVVWNLLSNAIKFTPQQGCVELRLERADGIARISVRDTGPGIDPDLLPRIFEPFQQGKNARSAGGLGLGLAIVHHIVELHHGSVRADSAGRGHGSTFIVELPVMGERFAAVEAEGVAGGGDDGTSSGLTSLTGVSVLVVDDHPDARDLLTTILQRAGAEAAAVASAAEALDAIRRRRVDVLVSDIGMPEEDGCELIRKVRELGPDRGGTIPAIAVTADARAEERSRAVSAGFQLTLAKPIDPARLTVVISQVIGNRGL